MKKERTDILIIGAGASGAASAWNLSKLDLKITCIDQGPLINKKEYSFNNKNREINKLKKFNIDPNQRKLISDYPINSDNSPISIANYNAVGGSTLIYSGHYPRFHPSDFKTKKIDNIGSNWLFSYYDLEKYYKLNDKMVGVSGVTGDPAYPKINDLLPPLDIGYSGRLIAKAFNKLGWHWWPSYAAIKKSKKFKKGIRPTAVEIYLNKAVKNGVIIKPNSRVLKIKVSKEKIATGVIYSDKKNNKKFLEASLILLASNGIGTPRILLNSKNKNFPNGLANNSGQLGKNLMLHPLGFVEGQFDNFLGSNEGPEGCSIYSHQFYETKKNRSFKRGYTLQLLKSLGPIESFHYLKKFNKIKFGNSFFKSFFDYFGRTIPIAIICEDTPNKNNNIQLDHGKKDSSGMPGIKINYKLSENTKKMLSHGVNQCKKLLKTAGAKSIIAFGPVKNTGWHLVGTAKMGTNKQNSVVNKFGQCHEIKNLFIIDSSIFPSSSGVNIASTVQAVSLMISDYIKKNLKKLIKKNV
jgi:choline dehydrogenase-like flavoprotein